MEALPEEPLSNVKSDWPAARQALMRWWRGEGMALHVTAPREAPLFEAPAPHAPELRTRWLDPVYRVAAQRHHVAHTFYGGVAFPRFDTNIGPGSLGLFLGCGGHLDEGTVWYEPSIHDPDSCGPLTLDTSGEWWRRHMALIEAGLAEREGLWLVSMPDLIENFDTLAQLRGPQAVLYDVVERPAWVADRIAEINSAFMEAFDAMRERIEDQWGGNCWCAFEIWGVGRTAKVQCDLCCAISPRAFRELVLPALKEQCAWLDNALFHLDGTQALPQLDNLLSIDSLNAIEWTPQAGLPGGGDPCWYELYRRIRAAGKSVQAIGVQPDQVEPLVDAVGADGLFVMTHCATEAEARRLLRRCGWTHA